jgi:hypothetical protein
VVICEKSEVPNLIDLETEKKLFFVNLGFCQEGVFTEMHDLLLEVALSADEVKAVLKDRSKSRYPGIKIHVDDCHVLHDNIDVEIPSDTNLQQQKFEVCLRKVRRDSTLYPRIIIVYWELP